MVRFRKQLAQIILATSVAAATGAAAAQPSGTQASGQVAGRYFFVISANLEQEGASSDPVVLYRISDDNQLVEAVTVVQAMHSEYPDWAPVGIFSIHEIGSFFIIEYPKYDPSVSLFIPEESPADIRSVDFNPEHYVADALGHAFAESAEGEVRDLWPVTSVPPVLDAQGYVSVGKTILRSVCEKPAGRLFITTNEWDQYLDLRMDGTMSYRELVLLSSQGGKLITRFVGGPSVDLGAMPLGFRARPRSGPRINPKDCFTDFGSSVCPDGVGVTLEAANKHFLVAGMRNSMGEDHNADVFAKSIADGRWMRLPVLSVAPTSDDRMYYRLFDDWLVTSASAALLAANNITETVVPEVLTVVETGKQRNDLAVKVESRTATDVATLPARRITLWNLADGRRIDLAIPEDDSEVVHVFDGHQVLLRIHDKLFFAEIQGLKLADYKLVAFDSAILQVHWAFYSPQ
jgi:hypothetical protein